MMSIGDSMLNHAGRLDESILQAGSAAMATPIARGNIMSNKAIKITAKRIADLLSDTNVLENEAKEMPSTELATFLSHPTH